MSYRAASALQSAEIEGVSDMSAVTSSKAGALAPEFQGEGPLNRRVRSIATGSAMSVALGMAGVFPRSSAILIAALGSVGAVLAFPAAVLTAVLLLVEEQTGSGGTSGSAHPLLKFGRSLLYGQIGGLRLVVCLAVVTIVGLAARSGRHAGLLKVIALPASLAVLTAFRGFYEGLSLFGAVTAAGTWIVMVAGVWCGLTVARERNTQRLLLRIACPILLWKVISGVIIFFSGTAGKTSVGSSNVFYDSLLPAVALSILVAMVLRLELFNPRWRLVFLGAVLILAFLGPRRNVLLGAVCALLVGLLGLFGRRKFFFRSKYFVVFALFAAVITIAPPPAVKPVSAYVHSAIETVLGKSTSDTSSGQHVSDLSVGLELAREHPLMGLGVTAQQPPGLSAVKTYGLYIHSEVFQTWLRLGLLGLLLLLVMVGRGVRLAIAALRQTEISPVQIVAACFLLLTPITLVFFPHLSTTFRYAGAFGLALGMVTRVATDDGHPISLVDRDNLSCN